MPDEKDDELIRRTLHGDNTAWAKLIQRHADRLFNTVHRLLSNVEVAQDIVQETFINAFQSLSSFKGDCRFFTWLYRIAYNAAIKHRQKLKDNLASDPGKDLDRDEQERRIQAALQRLFPEHRQVLMLKDMEGQKYEAIAEILKVPVDAVRKLLHKARQELRALVKEGGNEPGKQTDSQLTAAAQFGNHGRFSELMLRYEDQLRAIVRDLVNEPQDRDRVRKQIVINVFKSLKTFNGDMPFVTWLYLIVKTTVNERKPKEEGPEPPK
jgi:RNA polymerase sigma-70 factor (ECF subfamily)